MESETNGLTWRGLSAEVLDLLHREGELSPTERSALEQALQDPAVIAAHSALTRGVTPLRTPPTLPHSVAPATVAEIRLTAALEREAPTLPRSVAAAVSADIGLSQRLRSAPLPAAPTVAAAVVADTRVAQTLTPPLPPRSVAAMVARRVGAEVAMDAAPPLSSDAQWRDVLTQVSLPPRPPIAASLAARIAREAQPDEALPSVPVPMPYPAKRNPAPLLLVGSLLAGLTLLTVTSAWPNLHAGALILQAILGQISPLIGFGLVLLALTSALVTWRPTPQMRQWGAAAFAVAGLLTIPPLYGMTQSGSGLSFGQTVVVSGPVAGDIVSIAGDVRLERSAKVTGRVVTLLGDIEQASGAQVSGETNALLGRGPNEVTPKPQPAGVGLATAAAFRPLLGWLNAAAWPQIFVALTGGLLLLLFVGGVAPVLARRQRHAPTLTLALGVLMLLALVLPAVALGVSGLLVPALLMLALVALLVATGLSVSLYDAGRALACRLRLPVPDTVGAILGLSTLAASLSLPPLAFVLAVVGGVWGAGTLFLQRQEGKWPR